MGLFDFLRRRRESESATPEGMSSTDPSVIGTTSFEGTVAETGGVVVQGAQGVPIPGVEGAADLQEMINKAFESGNVSVTQSSQVLDLRNLEGLRESVLDALRQYGVDPEGGEGTTQVTDPSIQQAVFAAMAEHGVDVEQIAASGQAADAGAGPIIGETAEDTVTQLERLQSLRQRGVLTDEEFEEQKRQILGR